MFVYSVISVETCQKHPAKTLILAYDQDSSFSAEINASSNLIGSPGAANQILW